MKYLEYAVAPFVTVSIAGLAITITQMGFSTGVAVGTGTLALVALILMLEVLLPLQSGQSTVQDRGAWNDLGHMALFLIAQAIFQAALLAVLASLNSIPAMTRLTAGVWPVGWPWIAEFMFLVVIADFFGYWRHRLLHSEQLLWPLHAIHHSPSGLNAFKKHRFHFAEAPISAIIVFLPLTLLGAPHELSLWYLLAINIAGYLSHSNVRQRFPAWLHFCVVTQQVHFLHHSANRHYQDANYGFLVPLWDLVFHTYRRPDEKNFLQPKGVEGLKMARSFRAELMYPARENGTHFSEARRRNR